MISSTIMIRDALHCIFVRPLCSEIAWFRLRFHIDTHLLSSLLPFLHVYPTCVVWKGPLALFSLMSFLDVLDPVLLICTSDTLLGQVRDSVILLRIGTCFMLWLISSYPRKPPSAFCCFLFVYCCCFSLDTFACSCWFLPYSVVIFQSHRPLSSLLLDINIFILSYLSPPL